MSDGIGSLADVRGLIVKGLRARRQEIEQSICTRIHAAVPHPATRESADYESGLQEAISAVLGFGLDALEKGPDWSGPAPASYRRPSVLGYQITGRSFITSGERRRHC